MADGRRYSLRGRATARAAWRVAQKHCPAKGEAQCKEIIKQWVDAGVLVEETYDDRISRKAEMGARVDPMTRPRY
jgi:hypothetical protein